MVNENGSKFSYFLIGLGLGAGLGLLFAPRSGHETRERLREEVEEGKKYLAEKTEELRDRAEQYVENDRETLRQQRESLAAAIEAGKQAYREEKQRV